MAAKPSAAGIEARRLVEAGATAYRAAKDTGLTVSAITRAKWYVARQATQPARAPSDAEDKARVLVLGGMTAYRAAKLTGVSESTINRAKWYRDHKGPK
jgi:predicted transcriptional regulator